MAEVIAIVGGVSAFITIAESLRKIGKTIYKYSRDCKQAQKELILIFNDVDSFSALLPYCDEVTRAVQSDFQLVSRKANLGKLQKKIIERGKSCQKELEEFINELEPLRARRTSSVLRPVLEIPSMIRWYCVKLDVPPLRASLDSILRIMNLFMITMLLHAVIQRVKDNPSVIEQERGRIEHLRRSLREGMEPCQQAEQRRVSLQVHVADPRSGIIEDDLMDMVIDVAQEEIDDVETHLEQNFSTAPRTRSLNRGSRFESGVTMGPTFQSRASPVIERRSRSPRSPSIEASRPRRSVAIPTPESESPPVASGASDLSLPRRQSRPYGPFRPGEVNQTMVIQYPEGDGPEEGGGSEGGVPEERDGPYTQLPPLGPPRRKRRPRHDATE